MSNLDRVADRTIAVATNSESGPETISGLIAEYECEPTFYKISEVPEIDPTKFDAIVLDDVLIQHEKSSDRVIRQFQKLSLPIAAIGKSTLILAKIFGPDGLEVASSTDDFLSREFIKTNAVVTDCAKDDYISDRDHKILTTSGADLVGIRKMLRELIEMA